MSYDQATQHVEYGCYADDSSFRPEDTPASTDAWWSVNDRPTTYPSVYDTVEEEAEDVPEYQSCDAEMEDDDDYITMYDGYRVKRYQITDEDMARIRRFRQCRKEGKPFEPIDG